MLPPHLAKHRHIEDSHGRNTAFPSGGQAWGRKGTPQEGGTPPWTWHIPQRGDINGRQICRSGPG